MAEQPPTGPTSPDTAEPGKDGGGSTTWKHGPPYPNPPEAGWREGPRYPNPPDPVNPDPNTLRDQRLYAARRYSRWYSRAWGAAILAGAVLFAVGWAVKGSNPLPSHDGRRVDGPSHSSGGQK